MEVLIFAAGFVLFIAILTLIAKKLHNKKISCPYCKTKYSIDDVSYKEVSRYTKSDSNNEKVYSKVEFTAVCGKCGRVKKFSSDFCTYTCNLKTGSEKTYDLEDLIEKFFK